MADCIDLDFSDLVKLLSKADQQRHVTETVDTSRIASGDFEQSLQCIRGKNVAAPIDLFQPSLNEVGRFLCREA